MKFLFLLIVVVGCAQTKGQLSEKAKDLEVYATKPLNCHVVGKVVGVDNIGSTELATNDALNQALKFKATGIHIDQEVPNGTARSVYATAYECR